MILMQKKKNDLDAFSFAFKTYFFLGSLKFCTILSESIYMEI